MRTWKCIVAAAMMSCATPALAQSSDVAEMAQDLRTLIEAARQFDAAHPLFLQDLETLADRYQAGDTNIVGNAGQGGQQQGGGRQGGGQQAGGGRQGGNQGGQQGGGRQGGNQGGGQQGGGRNDIARLIFLDEFLDGDFTYNPRWTVREGQWVVDNQYGLRSPRNRLRRGRNLTQEELLQTLLTGNSSRRARRSAALIELEQNIPNNFKVVIDVTDHSGEGATHLIMHQGGELWPGYRLEIRAGAQPRLVLTRRGGSGYVEVASAPAPMLAFNPNIGPQTHQLVWQRRPNGTMLVSIEGELLIRQRDRGFRDPWTGFAIFNAGSDISFRSIEVRDQN